MVASPTAEHELTKLFLAGSQVFINGLTSLLSQLKSNGLPSLFLADSGPIRCITVRRDILDFECNNIAGPELAIDRQVKHRKIARSLLCLEFAPDGPNMFGPQRRFGTRKLSFVPRLTSRRQSEKRILIIHRHAPLLMGVVILCRS